MNDLVQALQGFGLLMILLFGIALVHLFVNALSSHREHGHRPAGSYLPLDELVAMIGGRNGKACAKLLADNRQLFEIVQGSTNNHQNWTGGYVDHVTDGMNVAVVLYAALSAKRPLPFTLSDALLVFFLHDIEKPWKYVVGEDGELHHLPAFKDKEDAHAFRAAKLREYGIVLTDEQQNGLRYVEGELNDYSNRHRVMGPLAAFCHLCDVTSARIWFDRPTSDGDPWLGATRHRTRF